VGRGVPSWLVLVCGSWRGVCKSAGSRWLGLSGVQPVGATSGEFFASVEPVQAQHYLDGTGGHFRGEGGA
jgi:hypothetical protein